MAEPWAQFVSFIILGAFVFFVYRTLSRGGGCCGGRAGGTNSGESSPADHKDNGCH